MGRIRHAKYKDHKCFFITTTCANFQRMMAAENAKRELSDSMNFLNEKYNSDTLGYVIMPNHFHKIIYFKAKNYLSEWVRDLKKYTAYRIRTVLEAEGELYKLSQARFQRRKQVFKIWDDRFDDVCLFTKRILEIKLAYIHNNPLQAHWRLVSRPEDWPHSSANFYKTGKQPLVTVTDYHKYFPEPRFINLRDLE